MPSVSATHDPGSTDDLHARPRSVWAEKPTSSASGVVGTVVSNGDREGCVDGPTSVFGLGIPTL